MITRNLLDEVIMAQKTSVGSKAKKLKRSGAHMEGKILLCSTDNLFSYELILRQAVYLEYNFTVGLLWTNVSKHCDISKDIILVRFQGPHDGKSPIGTDMHHDFHTHEICMSDIEDGRYSKPTERKATKEYNSFETAISLFLSRYHIMGVENHFTPFWLTRKELEGQLSVDDVGR